MYQIMGVGGLFNGSGTGGLTSIGRGGGGALQGTEIPSFFGGSHLLGGGVGQFANSNPAVAPRGQIGMTQQNPAVSQNTINDMSAAELPIGVVGQSTSGQQQPTGALPQQPAPMPDWLLNSIGGGSPFSGFSAFGGLDGLLQNLGPAQTATAPKSLFKAWGKDDSGEYSDLNFNDLALSALKAQQNPQIAKTFMDAAKQLNQTGQSLGDFRKDSLAAATHIMSLFGGW